MPVPLRIFKCYTTYFRKTPDVIKAAAVDPVRMPFIEKASMAVDYNLHFFLGCIGPSDNNIYCLLHRYLVLCNFFPSRYSHRILGAAGGISQTSKI